VIEIQQLKHFLALVEYRSFNKAAERLHITQSGLSRSIRSLEERLGLPLFERGSRAVTPTQYGRQLVARAHVILNEESRARTELANLRSMQSGSVRIGITLNFTHYLAPEMIADFARRHPAIDIHVVSGSFSELVDALRRSEVDLVFGLLASGISTKDLAIETLFESRSGVYTRPSHPLAVRRSVSPADLAGSTWIMLDSGAFQQVFTAWFHDAGLPAPRQQMTTNSLAFLRHAVLELGHLTVLPDELVAPDVRERRLVRLSADTPAGRTRAGIVYRKDALETFTPAVTRLIEALRGSASRRLPDAADVG
jgi:DNA-binding transcriptional LysR family regulator